jgi:hypothetical protein
VLGKRLPVVGHQDRQSVVGPPRVVDDLEESPEVLIGLAYFGIVEIDQVRQVFVRDLRPEHTQLIQGTERPIATPAEAAVELAKSAGMRSVRGVWFHRVDIHEDGLVSLTVSKPFSHQEPDPGRPWVLQVAEGIAPLIESQGRVDVAVGSDQPCAVSALPKHLRQQHRPFSERV